MTNKEKRNLYIKERRRVQQIIRRIKKQGFEVDFLLPPIPEKITVKDIRKLQDIKPITVKKQSFKILEDKKTGSKIREMFLDIKRDERKAKKLKSIEEKRKYAYEMEKRLFNLYKKEGLLSSKLFHRSEKINERYIDEYINRLESYLRKKTPSGELVVIRKKQDVRISNAVKLLDDFGAPELSEPLKEFSESHSFARTEALIKRLESIVKINLWESGQPVKGISDDMISEGLDAIEEEKNK